MGFNTGYLLKYFLLYPPAPTGSDNPAILVHDIGPSRETFLSSILFKTTYKQDPFSPRVYRKGLTNKVGVFLEF